MKKLERFINEKLMPFTEKITKNKILSALMVGFIRTSAITFGIAFSTIVGNFPVPGWTNYLNEIGIMTHINAITNGATGVLTLYVIYSLAMAYANRLETNEKNSAIVSLAFFIMIIPHNIITSSIVDGQVVDSFVGALKLDYLGGQGLFIGMLVALFVTRLYAFLEKKNIMFKLPDTVPPMVSQSLSPVFVVTIIFVLAFVVRVAFSFTESGNIINFFIQVINAPLNSIIASPLSIILIVGLLSTLWFFGIHNAVLQGPLGIVSLTIITGNIAAFQAGEELPYLLPAVIYGAMTASGFLGLVIASMFKAKSSHFRQLAKLSIAPSIFNITEPMMFGVPIIFNPIFLIPQCFTQIITGFVTWGLVSTILPIDMNPMMSLMPWTTPLFIKMPLQGGLNYTILMLICFAITFVMWYPFLKAADKKEFELECENAKLKESVK
ncbi:MAG: PTS sugar transporter subunit IIC [Erysipelotrichaceae bacterium]